MTSVRVVDVLRRFVGTDLGNKVLIADFDRDRSGNLAAAVKKAGYETVVVQTGNAALERLSQRADIDVIAVNATIPMPLLPGLLAQLRTDIDIGRTPLFVTAAADRVEALQRQWEPRYRNVWVIAEATSPAELKAMFAEKVTQAAGKPLTDVERKDYAARSIEWLARLARGEVSGYDIRPAQGAILEALRSKELANLAIEAAGHLSGRDPQQALASLVLDGGRPAELRSKAAVELCRHIQQFGLALSAAQVKGIEDQFAASTDAKLKGNLALVLGSTHPTPRQTGERLQRYSPSFSAPPAAKPKEEKTEESKDN